MGVQSPAGTGLWGISSWAGAARGWAMPSGAWEGIKPRPPDKTLNPRPVPPVAASESPRVVAPRGVRGHRCSVAGGSRCPFAPPWSWKHESIIPLATRGPGEPAGSPLSPRRLLIQLEAAKNARAPPGAGRSPSKAPTPAGNMVTYELHSRPEQDKFSQAAKLAELEKRLSELEAAVCCEPDCQNPLVVGLQGASLMETVEILQAKVSTLDLAVLDQVEARLQSVLGKVNEIAKHKAAVEDADTQSKVHQLYEVVQRWSPMATTLPPLVQRLATVKQLHEQAMQFGQLLTHLDTTQQMVANSLKDNATLLTQVQHTMKENLAAVEKNFASLDARVKQLSQ